MRAFFVNLIGEIKDHIFRNSVAWILLVGPLFLFGNAHAVADLGWKLAVTTCGVIVFHLVRKQMFPYFDLSALAPPLADGHSDCQMITAMRFLGVCVLFGLLAHAIIGAIAQGL